MQSRVGLCRCAKFSLAVAEEGYQRLELLQVDADGSVISIQGERTKDEKNNRKTYCAWTWTFDSNSSPRSALFVLSWLDISTISESPS